MPLRETTAARHVVVRALALISVALVLMGCAQSLAPRSSGVERLYVIDCGETRIPDVSPWSPGFNVGKAATHSVNCYLIRHTQGWMLFDSGYPDALVNNPEGLAGPRSTAFRKKTLVAQMAQIGVTPAQVTRIAFSHTHGDHVGNANLFSAATLYIQQAEYDAAFGPDPAKFGFQVANYDKLRASTTIKLQGDRDVFGDGTVVILSTPGHTPGHQSLLVRLPRTGAVVLSGDAAHFRENFDQRRVPSFNFDHDASIASMDKLAAIVQKEKAQLWINHDNAQSATLRHAPDFYD
jgi:glyoxylase-like metal-dependent hydrolase (beta-lactamase superfamily II)